MEKTNLVNELTIKMGDYINCPLSELQKTIAEVLSDYSVVKMQNTLPSTNDGSTTMFLFQKFVDEKVCFGNKEKTIEQNARAVKSICAFTGKEINLIDEDDIKNWLNYRRTVLGNSDTTRQNYYRWLSSFMQFLADSGYIAKNPMSRVPQPKGDYKVKKPLNEKEIAEIKIACSKSETEFLRMRRLAMVDMMLDTGVRVTELVNIKIRDIDFDDKSIKVLGKGNKERIVYFGDDTLVVMEEYFKARRDNGQNINGYFLCTRGDSCNKLTPGAVRSELKEIGNISGVIRIHPHLMRHTFATRAIESGTPIEIVSNLLGHSSLNTTMIYVNISESYKKWNFRKT